MHDHFKGKKIVKHVVEKRAKGIMEVHGSELPGHLSAGADAAKQVAITLMILHLILVNLNLTHQFFILSMFALGFVLAKAARGSFLAWARLERLHRVLEQERYEIEHHRGQEREELTALYAAKGFEGELLEQVIDVMMADGDRLLKIMLEEELGLSLEGYQHPLQQGLGAGIGALAAALLMLASLFLPLPYAITGVATLILGLSAAFAAKFEDNRILPAVIWNIAIGGLCFGVVYFALHFIQFQA